jgi:alpha-galactosidase
MKYFLIVLSLFTLAKESGYSINPFAKWTKTELTLCNGIVSRTIKLPAPDGMFLTTSYKPFQGDFNYFSYNCTDFQFEVNDVAYSGKSQWGLVKIGYADDSNDGSGAVVTLLSSDKKIELTVKFLMYPNSPAIRKSLIVKNLTGETIKLESVDIEKLDVRDYYPVTYSWIYHDFGRRRYIGNYDGGKQDALIIVHDMNTEQGIVLGNEATGVLKHTSVFYETQDICIGLTHKNSSFPFRKWIATGESFETPQVFTMVYNNQKTPDNILNSAVPDFVRKYMGIRLSELKEKPTFVYNTWEPFYKEVNEKLVMELAKAAADAGMKEFVIDDGWQDSYGDWGIDFKKFPNGLKPVFDYIKSLGMKPGLWVSIGSASPESKVYKAHPEWFVTDRGGKPTSLHAPVDKEKFTACFGTGWYDYIKVILLKMAADYGIEYYKLDFSVVTSAYTYDHNQSGCYSTAHAGHRDHNESLFTNYERLWKLFDELHEARPELFIDCTFETLGATQAIDYSLVKHAEGDWLSNFAGAEGEKTDIRIRNMAWWRSPAMPATALVIGNPQMQDPGWETHIKSIAGALPIMLGDPRKLSESDLKIYRRYADWLQLMESKYGIMSFRQDLPGFGEPMEGMWDGFQRINTETNEGGIIGVFRHGSVESKRIVTVNWLDPLKTYHVKTMEGKVVATSTGSELKTNGFTVTFRELYSGELFEICVNNSGPSDRVPVEVNFPLTNIGFLKPRSTNEIEASNWMIGCETLDRDFADYDQYKEYLVPLGIKMLRMQAGWAKTEKIKGVYDFTWLDRIIDDAAGRGLKPWLQTSYGNTIYAGGGGANLGDGIPVSKEALEAWDKWVIALVTRYKDKVKDWEIWNEPNFGDNTLNTPEMTAGFNIRTAEIIKSIQNDARISGLSMGHISIDYAGKFFKYITDRGKMGLFDNMTYHDYFYNPDANYKRVEEFRSVLWRYAPGMKIRQGENGAPSEGGAGRGALWDYNWSEQTQAKWDTRRMLGNLGHDIECSIFGIIEMAYNSGPINRMNYKGILKSDSMMRVVRPKIAYYAIQNVTSVFDNSLERINNLEFTHNIAAAGPDEHKYSHTTDRSLAVYGYCNKVSKKQAYSIWLDESIPSDSNNATLQTFVFSNGNFDNPVFVDIVSGRVYEIPSSDWSKKGVTYSFKNIPVYDAPILIIDKSLVLMK